MFEEMISNAYIVSMQGTSEGTQIKYKKDNYWYKKNNRGREGLCEYLSSHLLTFSTLAPSEYVLYELGHINNIEGCRSKNFLEADEELITFYRLYYNEFGTDLSLLLAQMDSMEERIDYVIRFMQQSCGLDITDYLKKIFTLDMLILNEDRHLNNLAVIFKKNEFIPAPIFDNGVSLLTANQSIHRNLPISENVKRVVARPFSGSHKKMFEHFGAGFGLDFSKVYAWLETEEKSFEKDILTFQLKRYEASLL